MQVRFRAIFFVILTTIFLVSLFGIIFFPASSHAISNPGGGANADCKPGLDYRCFCGTKCTKDGPPGGLFCPCGDLTSNFTTSGQCTAPVRCTAKATSDGTFDLEQKLLDEGLKQVMKLLEGGKPAGQTPGEQSYGNSFGSEECFTGRFQTSDISQLSNPCAEYVPEVSGGIDTGVGGECDPIRALLGTCGGTNTNTPVLVPTTNTSTTSAPLVPPRRTIFQPNLGGLNGPATGLRGDILTRFKDATVLAGSRDEKNNVEVAGFFGSETFGNQQPQSLVARWCQTRPWATNFLSKIVTPSFFDNICKSRGYQVGIATSTTPQVTLIQKSPTKRATSTPATSTPTVQPKVDIWASPPSVTLGGRTSIFWNAQGVVSCTETASDGNFNQQSLSGGAATVPITEATTFTITCSVSDGTSITASTVVGLKI